MRTVSNLIAGFFRLYGFGVGSLRRRAGPIRIGYGSIDRRYG